MDLPLPFRAIIIADCDARIDNACTLSRAFPHVPMAVLLRNPHRREREVARLAGYARSVAPPSLTLVTSGVSSGTVELAHLPFAEVERVGDLKSRGVRVGASVHDLGELRVAVAQGVEWVTFSPIYPTASKPGHPGHGVDALRTCCDRSPVPVFALGGISSAQVSDCLSAGAYGIAGISMFDRTGEGGRALATIESFIQVARDPRCR